MAEDKRGDSRDASRIKVTDKRMFTADGELREDFQHLEDQPKGSGSGGSQAPPAEPPSEKSTEAPAPPAAESRTEPPSEPKPAPAPETAAPEGDRRVEMPDSPGGLGAPGFMELISVLAEPIAVYLGDAKMPDGSSAENPEAARFYIDLLEVLQKKTVGNLSAQEGAILEDLLYQLRMRYVRKRG